jgi:hypothetical protein
MSEMKLTEFLELLKNADGNTGLSLVESYQAGGVQSLANHDADVIERACAKLVPWNESGITSKDQLLEMVMV